MIVDNVVKDLIGQVLITSSGAPKLTGTIYCLVRLELDGDGDDGLYWDTNAGGDWVVFGSVVSWPTASHILDGDWLYQLPAAASNGKYGGRIRYRFTDDPTGAATSVVNGGGEHNIQESFSVWDEEESNHAIAGTFGKRLKLIGTNIIHEGTAAGPGVNGNEIDLDAAASSVDGAYDPAMVVIVAGTGEGQTRGIYEYIGATRRCVVDRDWKILPDATSQFQIIAWAGREHVNEGQLQAGSTTAATLNALASSVDNAYKDQFLFFRSGAGQDQMAHIDTYDGTTKVATFHHALPVAPDSTTGYVVLPYVFHEFDEAGWTTERAAKLDNLDVAVSTRATPGDVWAITGAHTVQIRVKDGSGNLIENCACSIYLSDTTTFVGRLPTQSTGLTETFGRDAGTYYVTPIVAGYLGAQQAVTVSGDGILDVVVTAQAPPAAVRPTGCVVSATLWDGEMLPVVGEKITFQAIVPAAVSTAFLQSEAIVKTSDASGLIYAELAQGKQYTVVRHTSGLKHSFTVPATSTYDLTDILN